MSVKLLSPAEKAIVVPVGTKDFLPVCDPAVPKVQEPRWLAMPPGVRVRSKKCVEIYFTYNGETHFERLKHCRATVGGVLAAADLRESVLTMIANGRLAYSTIFPDSPRVRHAREEMRKAEAREASSVTTIGEALDAWVSASWLSISPNAREDYVKIIRNQLKPLDLVSLELPREAFIPGKHSGTQPRWAGFQTDEGLVEGAMLDLPDTTTLPSTRVQLDIPLESHEEPSTRRRRKASMLRKQGDLAGAANVMVTKTIFRLDPLQLLGTELAFLRADELTTDRLAHVRDLLVGAGVNFTTVGNRLSPLRQALARLVPREIAKNPFEDLKPLTRSELVARRVSSEVGEAHSDFGPVISKSEEARDEEEIDPFDSEEIESIAIELEPAMQRYAVFEYQTGMRTGEMIGLHRSDLHLADCRVHIRRSQSRGTLKAPKTNHTRWVDLNELAMSTILEQIESLTDPDGWLFPNPFTDRQWAGSSKIAKRWKKACERAGVRYRRPYQLRHSYASMMLSAGENVMYVAEQMGHEDWHMLLNRYARYIPSSSGRVDGEASGRANGPSRDRLSKLIKRNPPPADPSQPQT